MRTSRCSRRDRSGELPVGTLAGVLPHPRPARPTPRLLADVAGSVSRPLPPGSDDVRLTGVTLDSHAVRDGDLYAGLPGARTHGAMFAHQAVRAGARAVLTDPTGAGYADGCGVPVLVVDDPRERLGEISRLIYGDPVPRLIGITGTNGKTTVSYLVEAGLRAAGLATGLIGTVETRIGHDVLPSARTTPEAPDLQALLAVMGERGVQAVAMEVSSHALALNRVDGLRFAVAAFTNLSQDHLDFHGDLEDYFAAKARLFDGRAEHEVVDIDGPYGRRLAGAGTVTVSAVGDPLATWWASDVQEQPGAGSRFTVHGPDAEVVAMRVRLPGRFNVANALLALAVLATAGVDPRAAADGIAGTTVPGRMEPIDVGQPFTALVDYAHTPDAVRTLLSALRPVTGGRLVIVLGCGGDRDAGKRPLMGEAAARAADLLVVTDDNPRSEDPAAIRAAMRAGTDRVPAGQRAEVVVVAGRRAAIAHAVGAAGAGDTVVVAGKGHEQGQEIAGVTAAFDDRQVLRELIASLVR